ncbi:DUF4225 domain-containing protein [Pseudomonas sp. NPDC089392]|uniref:DUF4225 domain-containing protein n=1 Tax=Pseudomonas sp. NPDC089392 TaxID=3364459 RepID=UPI0038108957
MNNSIEAQAYGWADLADVSHAAMQLTQHACEVGGRCIQDDVLRMQFTQEVAYVGKAIVEEVESGNLPAAEGMVAIKAEQDSLQRQSSDYLRLVIGLGAGVMQIGTGIAICQASAWIACGAAGIPMVLHGLNNVYENAYNIATGHTDTVGPIRKGYQRLAEYNGGSKSQGNIAYGLGDLGLSAYGLFRSVIKPDAWRLFRYIEADKGRAINHMGRGALSLELGIDVLTGEIIYVELDK